MNNKYNSRHVKFMNGASIIFLKADRITLTLSVRRKRLMLIVDIVGGLGNQMYCYALYRTLLERGRDVRMNLSFYKTQYIRSCLRFLPQVTNRKYLLPQVFNITNERKLDGFRSLFATAAKTLRLGKVYIDEAKGFQPEVLDVKDGIISGYWQSFKYSEEIRDILRKEFTFKKPLAGKSAQVIDEIRSCNSVSISVRRDDYLNLGMALPDEYYINAMRYIQERVPDAKFFCTSDDIDYCRKLLGGGGA